MPVFTKACTCLRYPEHTGNLFQICIKIKIFCVTSTPTCPWPKVLTITQTCLNCQFSLLNLNLLTFPGLPFGHFLLRTALPGTSHPCSLFLLLQINQLPWSYKNFAYGQKASKTHFYIRLLAANKDVSLCSSTLRGFIPGHFDKWR